MMKRNATNPLVLCLGIAIVALTGCTAPPKSPGASIDISAMAADGEDINARLKSKWKARFPARMAIARIQGGSYSGGATCHGNGQYCLITARDFETDADFKRLDKLRNISSVAPMNRLLVNADLSSISQLRAAADTMGASVLMVYTINTQYTVNDSKPQAVSVVTLGLLATKQARVDSTATAAIVDVKTGAVFSLAEGTAYDEQKASNWSTEGKLTTSRTEVEQKAFQQMLGEIERSWKQVLRSKRRR